MKINRWIVVLLGVIALATSVAALCRACDRRVVESECSEVYRRYKDRDDLSVAFVKDYRIGDSITVDVTTIEAKDSTKWEKLLSSTNLPRIFILKLLDNNNENITRVVTYYSHRGDITMTSSAYSPGCELVVVSPEEHCLYVFDIETVEQADCIQNNERKRIIHKQ